MEELNFNLPTLEAFYDMYKNSMPSERSESKRRLYFKALPFDELTDEQLVNGLPREYAMACLEGYILCKILTGKFVWKDEYGSWYWQSKTYPDLVILKQWIVGKEVS